MAAVLDAPPSGREAVAEVLVDMLTDEPQTEAALARRLNYTEGTDGRPATGAVRNAMGVLEARHQAQRIHREGGKLIGWVRYDEKRAGRLQAAIEEVEFPYEFAVVAFDAMFVDALYQRPLTSFATRIYQRFDPVLFQTLVLSDRGTRHKPKRYALIDGQTRWNAAGRRGIRRGPSIVFKGLTPEDEAGIFWKLQKERRGVVSYVRFRAQLASKDPESLAIARMATGVGYTLDGKGKSMRAVSALEACYRQDPDTLERTLGDLREAWPQITPEGRYIRGLFFFFRHYPVDKPRVHQEVDDELLVRRLKVAGLDGLLKKQMAAREIHSGSPEKLMALAIQSAYLSRSK